MFGIGGQELIVILVIALIVLRPKKLPDLAKTLGKAFGDFQRATDDLKREMDLSSSLKDEGPSSASESSKATADATDSPEDTPGEETEQKTPTDGTDAKAG